MDLTSSHLETGAPISSVASRLVAANVYLGARPIAEALQGGGRFVITGRVADASLTLGPAAAHFGWDWDEWAKLAGASVAGHLIECGAQATGGLWHGWNELPDFAGVGYPIVEIEADGSCVITKPRGTGGQVSVGTVTEQLLYEIDDPARYRTPDVDVDFTEVSLEQVEWIGSPSSELSDNLRPINSSWSPSIKDGWTASGMLAVVGRDAEAKARAAGALILERVARRWSSSGRFAGRVFGSGDVAPGVIRPASPPFEVVLRVTVRDPNRAAVERFCRELAPLVTSGPPGIAGYASGRPSPRPLLATGQLWCHAHWPRSAVKSTSGRPRSGPSFVKSAEVSKNLDVGANGINHVGNIAMDSVGRTGTYP